MSLVARRAARRSLDVWPGFVDALASLLLVVVFVLLLFVLAQVILSHTLSEQDVEIEALHDRLAEIAVLLGIEQEKTEALTQERDELSSRVLALNEEAGALRGQVAVLTETSEALRGEVASLTAQAEADAETIKAKLLELASLQEDIAALREVRAQLEAQVGELTASLAASQAESGQLRDRSKALEARLADEEERTLLAQKEIENRDVRIQALSALVAERDEALQDEKKLSADARAEVTLLNRQIEQLRSQLEEINRALAAAEKVKNEQDETIEDLGKRLNLALARAVNKLERYRSEFFGRLREALGNDPSLRVEGDRFVFQSEVLFESASADLGEDGRGQLKTLAETLRDVTAKIPSEIDWILRVDGHTDRRPISTERYPSNWELSTARAVAVVRFLIDQGISPTRLSAAGFAEQHPLDRARTADAYQRNRRIEFKLTSR